MRDYEFAPDTFALTNLLVPPGMNIFGQYLTIPIDQVLTIGEDVIVVADDVVIRSQSEGGIGNEPNA